VGALIKIPFNQSRFLIERYSALIVAPALQSP
jgi:hypothetical protein